MKSCSLCSRGEQEWICSHIVAPWLHFAANVRCFTMRTTRFGFKRPKNGKDCSRITLTPIRKVGQILAPCGLPQSAMILTRFATNALWTLRKKIAADRPANYCLSTLPSRSGQTIGGEAKDHRARTCHASSPASWEQGKDLSGWPIAAPPAAARTWSP